MKKLLVIVLAMFCQGFSAYSQSSLSAILPISGAGFHGDRLLASDTIKYTTPLTFCSGGSVVLEADGVQGNSTFQWIKDGVNISGANSVTYTATVSGVYAVAVTTSNGGGGSTTVIYDSVTVTVLSRPLPTFTAIGQVCSGSPISFNSAVTAGTPPYNYSWDFGDGQNSTSANPSHTYVVMGCGTITYTAVLTVTDVNGCSNSYSQTIAVFKAPRVDVSDQNVFSPFSNCSNSPTAGNANYVLTINNASPDASCINSYIVDWGDGVVQNGVTFPLTHTYTTLGAFTLTVTGTGANGCVNSKSYTVANQSNPAVGISAFGSTTGCAPYGFWFKLNQYQNNSPGTTYTWDFGDGSPKVTWSMPINIDSIFHVFSVSSCTKPDKQYTVKVTAKNACDSTTATVNNIRIYSKPIASFSAPASACVTQAVLFTNNSTPAYNAGSPACNTNTVYNWNFGDPNSSQNTSNSTSPSHVFSGPGTYTVTLIAQGLCGNDTTTRTICIVNEPVASFTIDNNTGCSPVTVAVTNTSSTLSNCTAATYAWSVTYASGFCGTSPNWSYSNGTNAASTNPTFVFNGPGIYTIRLNVTNACGTVFTTQSVTVKRPPTVSIAPIANACGNSSISPSATVTNCGSNAVTYSWSFPGGSPSTSSAQNPGTVTYNVPGNYSVSLSVTNECGTTTDTKTFSVGALPTIIVPSNQAYCPGQTAGGFNFSSTAGSVTWTSTSTAIGLPAASGSGNINPFTATNSTINPITATITASATANGCTGQSSFTVTVNPKPATPTVSALTYCQGSIALPLTAGTASGNTVTWYDNVGLNNGSTTAPTPSTTTPGTFTYYVTQTNSAGCTSAAASISVTITPSINNNSIAADQTICAGTAASILTQSGSPVSGGNGAYTYSWQQSTDGGVTWTTITTATSTTYNPGNITTTTRYRRIISSGACKDTSNFVTITVLGSLSNFNIAAAQTICEGEIPATLTGSAPVGGNGSFSYQWETATNAAGPWTAIPGATGLDYLPGALTANTYFRRVTTSGQCNATSNVVLITVRAKPNATITASPAEVCATSAGVISFSGTGQAPYNIQLSITAPGGTITTLNQTINANTGTITIVPANSATGIYTVELVSITDNNSCIRTGVISTTSITVKPIPVVTVTPDTAICTSVTLTLAATGATTYSWSPGVQTGSSISVSPTATTTYTVTGTTNGCSKTATTTVTVNPKPVIPAQALTICSGNTFTINPVNSGSVIVPAGTTYSWGDPVSNPLGAITGGSAQSGQTAISQTLINTTNQSATLTYTVTPTSGAAGACVGAAFTVTVTVSPQPGVGNQTVTICSGTSFNATPTGTPASTTFTWLAPVSNPAGAITGGSAQASPTTTISQTLTNTTNAPATLTYTVLPSAGGCGSSSFTVTVNVNPKPVIPAQTATICTGGSINIDPVNAGAVIVPAGTSYSWPAPTLPSDVSGGIAGTGATISGTLVNTSNSVKTVVYDVTPTSGAAGACTGAPFTVTITINPKPSIADTAIAICSGDQFTVTPQNNTVNTVPANTSYNWSIPQVSPGVTGGTAGSGSSISGTLSHASNTTQTAVYTIAPVSGNCPGDSFTLTVQLAPKPALPAYTDTICSGATFTVTPVDGLPTPATVLPAGTSFTWNTPSVLPAGSITGASAQATGVGSISQQLTNTGNVPATVTYTVTPSVGNCAGTPFTVSIVVRPQPKINNQDITICSGQTFSVTPVNNPPGVIVPAGTLYSWPTPVNGTTGAITGGSSQSGATSISQTLTNTTNAVATLTYTITPAVPAPGCTGAPFTVVVSVNPQPGLSDTTLAICSGSSFSLVPAGAPAGTQYSWTAPVSVPASAITGGSAQANQTAVAQLLTNNTNTIASLFYTVTPTVGGSCGGASFVVKVRVAPKPVLPTLTATICTGNSFSITPVNGQPTAATIIPLGTTYTWTSPVSSPAGIVGGGSAQATAQSSISQVLTNTSNSPATLTYTVTPVSGDSANCTGSPFQVIATVQPDARAQFAWTRDTACAPFVVNNSVISLQPFPNSNSGYEWYVNNALIGTGNTFPGYTIATSGGSVTIKLVALSQGGCKRDSMEHQFFTYIAPQPSFTLSDTAGCGPLSISFNNTTPNIGMFNYLWDFGNGQTSTQAQPGTIIFQPNPTFGDTTYIVKMRVASGCDTITVQRSVLVKSKPKALFTPNSSVGCSPMTVIFTNISKGLGNTYTWNFGDGSPSVTTTATGAISHTFVTGVQDTFYVKLVATNECGADSMTYAIVVSPNTVLLDFAINGNQQSGCMPHTVSFINNSQGASTFTWDFGDGTVINTTQNIDTLTHTYLSAGTYVVTLQGSNGCSDTSSTETIIVYPRPVAAFTATPPIVCVGSPVNFTNQSDSATSYLWQFGDGNTSTQTSPVKTYATQGLYTVKLIAYRFNAVGSVCSDSTTRQVQVVSSLPGWFTASDTVGNCAPFTVSFTNQNTPAVSVTWDFGDGTTGTGNTVSHTYTQAGTYLVQLVAVAPTGCTYQTTRTITVNGPTGSWTHTTGYVCDNATASFQVSSSFADTLIYNFGDGTTLATTNNIVFHTYANPGSYLPSITLKNNAGCSVPLAALDTIKVERILAGFTYSQESFCGYSRFTFTDTSLVFFGKAQVNWNFGDGTTGSGINVVHDYTTSGTYPVTMVVIGNSGCSDTVIRQLVVVVKSKPVATVQGDTAVCIGYNNTFTANIQSIDAINFVKWTVSNGAVSTSNPFVYKFTQAGNYTLQLVVGTVNGCYDTVVHNIVANPSSSVTTANDLVLCRGNSAVLNTTGTGVVQYNWVPLQGLSCTSCASPTAAPLVTTPYVVQGTNIFGCSAYDTVVVTVIQPFDMTVSPSDTICIGQSANLLASGATTYNWTPAAGLSSTTISNPIASPLVTTNYRVVGYDGFNCFTDTAFVLVAVGQYPIVNLGPDLTLSAGTIRPMTNTVLNGPVASWLWTPGTDLNCTTCAQPLATIKKDVSHVLSVTNIYGCTGSDTINIKSFCESSQVFIPNAFTPDGDGVNDILMVRGKGIVTVKSFRIFNRWGEVVFEKANFPANSAAHGWNGLIRGARGGPDVYVYTAEVMCENGTSFTYKGNVTILK